MESLDLHPEELFDKAARGTASTDELARLDAHLAACATCRFERQVRADFDAIGGSAADLDDLVARALSGAKATKEPEVEGPRRRRYGGLLVAAVAMMGFASFAAVAQYTGVLPRLLSPWVENKREEAPAPPKPSRASLPSIPALPKAVVEPSPAPQELATQVPEVKPEPAPSPRLEPAPRPAPRAVAKPEPVKVVASEETPDIPAQPRAPEPVALDLFVRAHWARVHGETATAIRDFRNVVARFPEAPEAALAYAELGQMLLSRGEPASALEAFDAYLASKDLSLREEVRGARAMALQALNRPAEERAAWEALLRDYPQGVYAPRAKARLEDAAP